MKITKALFLYASMVSVGVGGMLGLANDAYGGDPGLCWDVRVQRHVPCGWNPPSSPSPPQAVPSGPSPRELELQQQEQLRLQRESEEEERRKRERDEAGRDREEASRQFEQDKGEALRLLKSGTEVLSPKVGELKGALGGGLELKSGTSTLGLTRPPNPTKDKNFAGDDAEVKRQLTKVERQLSCAGSIVSPSFSAARRGDAAEVRYLSGQARRAMLGKTLEVQCSISSSDFQEGPVTLEQLGPVFEKLGFALEKQAARINLVDQRIETATEGQAIEQANIDKYQANVKELKREIGSTPPPPPGNQSEEARTAADKKKEKERALKEALAALTKSTEALVSVERTLRQAETEKKEAEKELSRLESLFGKVLNTPGLAPEIEKQIPE